MLYKQIDNAYDLQAEMNYLGRDYFTQEGYQAMLDYYEDIDQELDVIALCCEWNEDSKEELIHNYGYLLGEYEEVIQMDDMDLVEELSEYTYIVLLDNGDFLYQAF